MSKKSQNGTQDAIRMLSNAIYMVHHFELTGEGQAPFCKSRGELILQDALWYLAFGDTHNARHYMDLYDEWLQYGNAPWPYDTDPVPQWIPPDEEIPF